MDQIVAEARLVALEQAQYVVRRPAAMAYPTATKLRQSGDFVGTGNAVQQRTADLLCQLGRYPLVCVE